MDDKPAPATTAETADHFYGAFLLLLAAASAAAPLFGGSVLPWVLTVGGLVGVCWLFLDRSPRGFLAAAGWTLITLALGLHLVLHVFEEMGFMALALTVGFVLMGASEILFGLKRFGAHSPARRVLVAGGAAAIAFGLALTFAEPALPDWAAGAAIAVIFAGFGLSLLFAPMIRSRRKAASDGQDHA